MLVGGPVCCGGRGAGCRPGKQPGSGTGAGAPGRCVRDRLPKIAELFVAGQISDLLVRAIVWRTWLIQDPEAMARVDVALAAQVTRWGALSVNKTEQAIDALVDEHDLCCSVAAVPDCNELA